MTGEGPPDAADWLVVARQAAAHVFVDDLADPRLSPTDAHHLRRVLRLRAGETVSVADGTGGWATASFVAGGGLSPLGEVTRTGAPGPPITVAMAVPKGDRSDWAVQKLTEIGVDRIIALTSARSVVRWDDDRAERHLARWRAVARQAAMQSRRLRVPVIEGPSAPAELAGRADLRASIAEPGGGQATLERPTILIGPEGGWSPEELAGGLPTVGLLPAVLRTETAAVVAATVLAGLRAGTVRPGGVHPPADPSA
jgi:16S rRNA (uracil1498-N3)-methyltransferase